MKATLLVITDGRRDCLAQSMPAFQLSVDQTLIERRLIIDDSGDPAYGEWIDEAFEFDVRISHDTRKGYAAAIRTAWDALFQAEYVFHLEDDFMLTRHVPLLSMMEVLAGRPHFAQMALRRQAWGPDEVMAGGYLNQDPYAYTDCWETERPDRRWLEHRKFFTTNPSVYPQWVHRRGWPQVPQSEDAFSAQLFNCPQVACGVWGHRHEPPWAIHIGHARVGNGY